MYTLGVNPTAVITPVTNTANIDGGGVILAPGTRAVNQDGNEYLLLVATGATTIGSLGFWDENFDFTPVSTSNDIGGTPLAIVRGAATADGQYFWAQTYGMGTVLALTLAAADVALETTGTAGAVDDSVTSGSFVIEGLTLMSTNSGLSTVATNARISYPHLAYLARA
jgi:hypothetical protein